MRSFSKTLSVLIASSCIAMAGSAGAADIIDPTPVAQQDEGFGQEPAVNGLNFKAGVVSGVIGGWENHMFVASVATPIPFTNSFGAQLDLGIGDFGGGYTSAAAALHLFWRDPSRGLLGIYGDWGYIDNEHGGRMGVEASAYMDRMTLDVFAGVRFGQHYDTEFVDEVDLSYYFTDDFKASIGHRWISRGHVANVGFEYMPDPVNYAGWSLFGEAEFGQDDYHGAWGGIRYAFGTGDANSLIDRDRKADPMVRIPRNLASLTRCGDIANRANWHKSWNGFETEYTDNICGSKDDLAKYGAVQTKLNSN